MVFAKGFVILILMISLIGCAAGRPIIVNSRDCQWAQPISWTMAEGQAIFECCPAVAEQMIAHNELHEKECP